MLGPLWVRSEETAHFGHVQALLKFCHISGAREGPWPVSLCGWTEEYPGDW